ncbi:MAG: alpha/beta fold hydrolase [Chloroflexi bacterium]|nr:alpha/beta fold hydrolase [Chloroflexota bacterium]
MRGYPRNRLTVRPDDEVVLTRSTQSRGYRISFDDAGAGPAIVLIPGGTMSAGDWRDAGYVDHLVGSHRVLSVDPVGLGQSDKPHDPGVYRLPDVATDIVAVMDAAGVDRAVLWGYSYGASVAGAVAVQYPDRVSGVIFHDGLPGVLADDAPDLDAEALMRGDWSRLWDGPAFTFSAADRRYDEAFNDPRAIGAMWLGERRSGSTADLARISVPTLVMKGRKGGAADVPESIDALGVAVEFLSDCDHLEAFSRVDLVLPIALGFLASRGL